MSTSSRSDEPRSIRDRLKKFLSHAIYVFGACFGIGLIIFWFQNDYRWPVFVGNMTYSFGYGSIIGFMMYPAMNWVAPRLWKWPKLIRWPALYASMLLVTVFGCLVTVALFTLIGIAPAPHFWRIYLYGLKIGVVICLLMGTVIIIYEHLRHRLAETSLELRSKELERQKALNAATAARLASLESKIHPHFLFNALNSISSLIPEDPKRAERLVEQMAALLRFSLDSDQVGLVPLDREMKIVADYLDIEQARYGERLRFSLNVPDELGGCLVPPLAVQTLVENSVKYAAAPRREGASVEVAARREKEKLLVEVIDDGPGFRADAISAGHGLDNLDARFTALFQGEGKLNIGRDADHTVVSILVPQAGCRDEVEA